MGPSGQSIRSMSRNQHEHVSPSCEREPRRGHLRTRAGFNRQAETPPWIRSGTVVELDRRQVEQHTAGPSIALPVASSGRKQIATILGRAESPNHCAW
ncbi:hypothetical protein TBK1r_23710 [Stieleria magnilauensis]|uniref:Uncharacterized protein n=1 Tax=Stieleria magnilauensis TaxID=2527963 RepID=A0ABX5XS38_9BACT|nr:hypothetical protein TBK1r_23710 [Planctomycetes bacterium TBK1r]